MKAVIFDLDDTLISEKQYVLSGYRAVAAFLEETEGFAGEKTYSMLKEELEHSAKNVFNRLYDALKRPYTEEDIKRLVKIYREHKPEIDFFEDVRPALKKLRDKDYALGVLTDGYLVTQKNKAEVLGLSGLFDICVFTDELGREYWKPSTKGFELIGQKLAIGLQDMIYIGDNPKKDFEIMKASPVKTVRIIRKDGVYTDEPYGGECRENIRINSLSELDGALKEISSQGVSGMEDQCERTLSVSDIQL